MCGLVAVVAKAASGFTSPDVETFSQLVYADQLRGKDGTGIFWNNKKGKAHIKTLKAPIKSSSFCATPEFTLACNNIYQQANFAVGHNRAATKGKLTVDCTHPFKEQHITLVHNGTLADHSDLHEDKEVEVDSHAICHSIANIGAEETLKKIDGAFALIWFDGKERTLNLCRNFQRPLYIIECVTCHIVVSELELGLWIAKRNNLTVTRNLEVPIKTIIQFSLAKPEVFTQKEVKYKEYVPYVYDPKDYEENPWWQSGKKHYSDNIGKSKTTYAFGETIRFKSGSVRAKGHIHYLEGDINKYLSINPKTIVKDDYEDEWRIRVYGTLAELEPLAGGIELVGKITGTHAPGQISNSFYYVNGVTPYVHKSHSTNIIPFVETTKNNICECCDKEYKGKGLWISNMLLCHACATDFAYCN